MKNTQFQMQEGWRRARLLLGGFFGGAALGLTAAVAAFRHDLGESGLSLGSQYLFADFVHDIPMFGRLFKIDGHPAADWWRAASDIPAVVQAAETLHKWLLVGGLAGAFFGALLIVLIVNKQNRGNKK